MSIGPNRTIFRPHLVAARCLMGMGASLKETAESLEVLPGDLDKALWHWIGIPDHEIPENMIRPRLTV